MKRHDATRRGPTEPDLIDIFDRAFHWYLLAAKGEFPIGAEKQFSVLSLDFRARCLRGEVVLPEIPTEVRQSAGVDILTSCCTNWLNMALEHPDAYPDMAAAAEAAGFAVMLCRHAFGGSRVRIKKTRGTARERQEEVAAALRSGLSPQEAFKAAGVSKSAGYRMISEKTKAKR